MDIAKSHGHKLKKAWTSGAVLLIFGYLLFGMVGTLIAETIWLILNLTYYLGYINGSENATTPHVKASRSA